MRVIRLEYEVETLRYFVGIGNFERRPRNGYVANQAINCAVCELEHSRHQYRLARDGASFHESVDTFKSLAIDKSEAASGKCADTDGAFQLPILQKCHNSQLTRSDHRPIGGRTVPPTPPQCPQAGPCFACLHAETNQGPAQKSKAPDRSEAHDPPGYIRPDDTPKISRLFRWTRIIQRHAINLACQSAEPSAYDEAARVRNFYRREIVKHSRSVFAATDSYRSQVHPQLDYVARSSSSSRTNE